MNQKAKILNRSNNKLDHRLTAENDKVMTDMVCYLRASGISEYDQEQVRQDLLEMALSAQERGDSISTVIGGDYQAFCDSVIENLPKKSLRQKICGSLSMLFLCFSILGAINIVISKDFIFLIRDLLVGNPPSFQLSISLWTLISFLLIIAVSIFLVQIICKTAFRSSTPKATKLKIFLIGAGCAALFLLLAWLGRAVVFTVPLWIACTAVLLAFLLYRLLERYE